MDAHPKYLATYELQRVILFAAAASSSLIFSVLFLFFLGSLISSHNPSYFTDTISEMMGYAEFFVFAFASYFLVSVLIWRFRKYFSKIVVSWLPIAVIGSFTFSGSFLFRIWISAVINYQKNDPFQNPPSTFRQLILAILITGSLVAVVALLGSGLVSAVVRPTNSTE